MAWSWEKDNVPMAQKVAGGIVYGGAMDKYNQAVADAEKSGGSVADYLPQYTGQTAEEYAKAAQGSFMNTMANGTYTAPAGIPTPTGPAGMGVGVPSSMGLAAGTYSSGFGLGSPSLVDFGQPGGQTRYYGGTRSRQINPTGLAGGFGLDRAIDMRGRTS